MDSRERAKVTARWRECAGNFYHHPDTHLQFAAAFQALKQANADPNHAIWITVSFG
jgi:hypothetical protein